MSNIKIETYRGYEIEFAPYKELFLSDVGNDGKESKTLSGARKQIDEYIKNNAVFEPLKCIKSSLYGDEFVNVVVTGIRKDLRFTYLKDGETKQIPDHEEKRCYIGAEVSHQLLEKRKYLKEKIKTLNAELSGVEKSISDHLKNFPTLAEKKKEIISKLGL